MSSSPFLPLPYDMRRRGVAGASLLEVIVVLFFIALMASLIQTLTMRTRQQLRQTQCLSHLRQLYLAHAAWMADHDQTLPLGYSDGVYHTYAASKYQKEFSRYLSTTVKGRYTGGSGAYLCPEDTHSRGTDGLPGYFGYSYGINGFMAVRNQNQAARWTAPSETFLLGDGVTTIIYGNDSYPERIDRRHDQRASFVFLDGHTRSLRLDEVLRPTTRISFWNAEKVASP